MTNNLNPEKTPVILRVKTRKKKREGKPTWSIFKVIQLINDDGKPLEVKEIETVVKRRIKRTREERVEVDGKSEWDSLEEAQHARDKYLGTEGIQLPKKRRGNGTTVDGHENGKESSRSSDDRCSEVNSTTSVSSC
ncbi:MAG: hypothetical protein QW303_02785 [Nitrososphaerota archaeon]